MDNDFRADDLRQIERIKLVEDDMAFFLIVTEIEKQRKDNGNYIWAFPIKWRDENGKTYRQQFGYEIEFENGKNSITYGYSGEELFDTYAGALQAAIQRIKNI